MKRAFVIGHPIAHSRSPLIHGHWLKTYGLEGTYEAIDVAPAALGAFFTSGSLSPPNAPPVPPGEFMTAKAVTGSVTMAAVAQEPEKAPEKFQEFVRLALEVADRTKLWPAA